MAVDLSVFGKIKTKEDFDRERELFNLAKMKERQSLTGQDPAAIREWQVYNSMSPEDQQRYLQMKRSDQIMNLGGSMAVRNPMGGIMEQYTVTPKISETPEFEASVKAAQKTAEIKAEDIAKAQSGLGNSQEQTNQMLDLLNEIEGHKGLSAVVGVPNPLQGRIPFVGNVAGSPAADFQTKLDQLGGKQFLQAFEILKGGGAITQIEGEKATNAIASMQTAQSEDQFIQSLNTFKEIVQRAAKRAQAKAQQDPMQQWYNAQMQQDVGNPNANIPQMMGNSPALNMPTAKMTGAEKAETIFNAKKAIQKGADADMVRQRLIDAGIDPSKAGL